MPRGCADCGWGCLGALGDPSRNTFHFAREICGGVFHSRQPRCVAGSPRALLTRKTTRNLGHVHCDRCAHQMFHGVLIAPLLAWYHADWDQEPDITTLRLPPLDQACVDFRRCRWPAAMPSASRALAEHVDSLNDLSLLSGLPPTTPIVSFSHFLPRQDLLPEKRMLFYPNLPKMAGSSFLARRVTALRPAIHIFGHTHFGWDATHDGTRFVQAPLCYPTERRRFSSSYLPSILSPPATRANADHKEESGHGPAHVCTILTAAGAEASGRHPPSPRLCDPAALPTTTTPDTTPTLTSGAAPNHPTTPPHLVLLQAGPELAPVFNSRYTLASPREPTNTEPAPWVVSRYAPA
eukprot:m.27527 g.27527  ORF g.27527 m.27527 type:complete len:351 (+) comp9022_c0_seq2:266-1318(+)